MALDRCAVSANLKYMGSKTTAVAAIESRIGERRRVVIPKPAFDALRLQAGDFVEITVERGRLAIRPKRRRTSDVEISKSDAAKILRGEAQLKAGLSKPWRTVRDALGD